MEISLGAIEICAEKYGVNKPVGFEKCGNISKNTIGEEELKRIFGELTKNELLDSSGDGIGISLFGKHIMNMMTEPEMYVQVENNMLQINVKVYFKDVYYLCIVENMKDQDSHFSKKIQIVLLPDLKGVVSSFAYALYCENAYPVGEKNYQRDIHDIYIVAKAWEKDRNLISDVLIEGDYYNSNIQYKLIEKASLQEENNRTDECEISDFVNLLTEWILAQLLLLISNEENANVRY